MLEDAEPLRPPRVARNPASDFLENELAMELETAASVLRAVIQGNKILEKKTKAQIELVSGILERGIRTCRGLADVLDSATRGGRKALPRFDARERHAERSE